MIRFFNANNPSLLVVLFFYALMLNFVMFLAPEEYIFPTTNAPLSQLIYTILHGISFGNFYVQAFFSLVLVYVQALLFNSMVNRYKLFDHVSYVPAAIFVLMCVLVRDYLFLSPVLFSNLFIIIILDKAFAIYKKPVCFQDVFDIGFLIGVSSLIYFPTVMLMAVLFIALGILRAFAWREWVIGILGFLTPNILVGAYYFLRDYLVYFFKSHVAEGFQSIYDFAAFSLAFKVVGGFVLVLLLVSIFIMLFNYMNNPIQIRKYLTIIFWTAVLLMASFVLMSDVSARHFTIISVPLSFIITYGVMKIDFPRIIEGVYWLLILTILFFQYLPFFGWS